MQRNDYRMNSSQVIEMAKQEFARQCSVRGVAVAQGVPANWRVFLLDRFICSFGIGPKRHGEKPIALLFEASYARDGALLASTFPEGVDNKYFVPNR